VSVVVGLVVAEQRDQVSSADHELRRGRERGRLTPDWFLGLLRRCRELVAGRQVDRVRGEHASTFVVHPDAPGSGVRDA
jgi:hypothetical protein